jgi:hypothetical protein
MQETRAAVFGARELPWLAHVEAQRTGSRSPSPCTSRSSSADAATAGRSGLAEAVVQSLEGGDLVAARVTAAALYG